MKKRVGLIIGTVCAVLSVFLSGCGVAQKAAPPYKAYESDMAVQSGIVKGNTSFRLEWDEEYKRILLVDKRNGLFWSTTPYQALEERLDEYGLPKANHPQVNSPILLEYLNPEDQSLVKSSAYISSINKQTVSVEEIDNGIKATYYFGEEEFSVPVEYILRESGILITVDADNIHQGRYQLCRVIVAPFMCALENTQKDGYLFYPSGSGALIYPQEVEGSALTCSQEVYGYDASRYLPYQEETTTSESVRLPVYGIKSGNRGLCAIIEEGAESASIETSVGASNIGFSSVYTAFDIRGYQWVKSSGNYSKLYSESVVSGRLSVGFYPLYGNDANYSGMAKIYRDYLKSCGGLSHQSKETILSLQILGGVHVQDSTLGIPSKKLFVNTNVNDAQGIVQEISEETGNSIAVNLVGFGKSGLDVGKIAGGYTLNSKLGSTKELKTLTTYCKNMSMPLYMNFDIIYFNKSGNGASLLADKAIGSNGRVTMQYPYSVWSRTRNQDADKYYLVSRLCLPEIADRLSNEVEKLGLCGVGLDTLSKLCYSDYSETRSFVKGSMSEDVTTIMKSYQDKGFAIAVNDANDYAAAYASQIFDVPLKNAEYDLFDETIPFYAMVFKGNVSLSSSAVNLATDKQTLILRAIEAGCGFTFMVSKNYDSLLMDTTHSVLFGTLIEDVMPSILETVEQYSSYYDNIQNATITDHAILDNGVRKTTFSNGVFVYVNYSDKTQIVDQEEIGPKSYKQVGGNGK